MISGAEILAGFLLFDEVFLASMTLMLMTEKLRFAYYILIFDMIILGLVESIIFPLYYLYKIQ